MKKNHYRTGSFKILFRFELKNIFKNSQIFFSGGKGGMCGISTTQFCYNALEIDGISFRPHEFVLRMTQLMN